MTEVKKRIAAIEKKLAEIESGQELQNLRIIWKDIETGEQEGTLSPGAYVIYWGAGDEIGTYRYDPKKPNGGEPDKKRKGG